MTCKVILEKATTTHDRKLNLKIGLTKKQKNSRKTWRNKLAYRNQIQNQNSKSNDNESSSHLVETEFKILQSLIPGISHQPHISELEIIDACVQYIETLQGQLEHHLVQNPHLYVESQDSRSNTSSELLHNLLYRQQESQNDTTLDTSTNSSDAYESQSIVSIFNSSTVRQRSVQYQTNLQKLVDKQDKVDKSNANYLNNKKFRIRC